MPYAVTGGWVSGTVSPVNRYLNGTSPYTVPLTYAIFVPQGATPGDTSYPLILHFCASLETGVTAWNVRNAQADGIIADGFPLIAENNKTTFPAFILCVRVPNIGALGNQNSGDYFTINNCRWTHRRAWEMAMDIFNAGYTYDHSRLYVGGFSAGGQNVWGTLKVLYDAGRIPLPAGLVENSARLDAFQFAPPVAATWTTVLVDDRTQGTKNSVPPFPTADGKYLVCSSNWDYLGYGTPWDLPAFDPMSYSSGGVNNIYDKANQAAEDLFESWFPNLPTMIIAGKSDQNYDGKGSGANTNAYHGVIKGGTVMGQNGFGTAGARLQGQAERWDSSATRTNIAWYGVDGSRVPINSGVPTGSGALPPSTITYSNFNMSVADKSVAVVFAQTSGSQWAHGASGFMYESGYGSALPYSELSWLFWVGTGRDYTAAPWAWMLGQRRVTAAGASASSTNKAFRLFKHWAGRARRR